MCLFTVHFLRHKELTEQIEKLQDEINEQKDFKAAFLDRMGCKSENDVPKYQDLHTRNDDILKQISADNTELEKQCITDKAEFIEINTNHSLKIDKSLYSLTSFE